MRATSQLRLLGSTRRSNHVLFCASPLLTTTPSASRRFSKTAAAPASAQQQQKQQKQQSLVASDHLQSSSSSSQLQQVQYNAQHHHQIRCFASASSSSSSPTPAAEAAADQEKPLSTKDMESPPPPPRPPREPVVVEMQHVSEDIRPNMADKPNQNLPKSHELENIRAWNIFTQLVIIVLLLLFHMKLLTDYFRDRKPRDSNNASVLTKDQQKKILLFEANKEVGNVATLLANDNDD